MHMFVSSKYKHIQKKATEEIEKLLQKVIQEYKVHYEKKFRKHAFGVAYRLFHIENHFSM